MRTVTPMRYDFADGDVFPMPCAECDADFWRVSVDGVWQGDFNSKLCSASAAA